jgi:hypothetical protein
VTPVFVKNLAPPENESSTKKPVLSILQTVALNIRDEAFRGARAIDRGLDAFYLPMEAQEQKKKCRPDKADAIRLHALGVRW